MLNSALAGEASSDMATVPLAPASGSTARMLTPVSRSAAFSGTVTTAGVAAGKLGALSLRSRTLRT
jgi:hypothetical protein